MASEHKGQVEDPCCPSHARNRSGYLVIMTACIDPSNTAHIVRKDPLVRLADYMISLRFWLELPDRRLGRILFLENSGYPLEALKALAEKHNPRSKRIEFLSMRCNDTPAGIGYGYSEMAMLDEGLPRSTLAAESLYWIKTTGRLRFPRISRLLARLPADFEFSVDSRDNDRFIPIPQRFVVTQLMIFRADFFEREIYGIKSGLSPSVPLIENLLYQKLMPLGKRPGSMLRWPVSVDPCGYAAHWQKDYGSRRNRAVNFLRSVCRKLFPSWWV